MTAKKITGYTILLKEQLGKGAYGSVYKGQQDNTKMECAIKMINKKNINQDDYLKSALFSEIQILKTVKSVNIVGFFDVLESSQNYYIVQELCDNDLEKFMKQQGGKFLQNKSIQLLKQICNGFLSLVRQGIVHRQINAYDRDLKPANIMLSKNIVKIGDFGFAKKNFNKRVKNQSSVGTPLYMSIQILKGQLYTSKCDIWALGFIFYELTHGVTPWTAQTQFQLIKNIQTKPLKINKSLSPDTVNFLQRCLAVYQVDRISWDQLFLHPIFNGEFQKYAQQNKLFENKLKKIMTDLRFMINSQNIDLIKLFERFGFTQDQQLNIKQLQKILRAVNPNITTQQQIYIFQKLDQDDSGTISLKQLENQMAKNHISLRSRFSLKLPRRINRAETLQPNETFKDNKDNKENKCSMSQQLQIKIRNCFNKLYKTLTVKKLTLYKAFIAYDTDKSGMLSQDQFNKIMKKLDSSFVEEQLQWVFRFIDIDNSKTIEFDEFNLYYSKINGLPQNLDLPSEYIQKDQEKRQKLA